MGTPRPQPMQGQVGASVTQCFAASRLTRNVSGSGRGVSTLTNLYPEPLHLRAAIKTRIDLRLSFRRTMLNLLCRLSTSQRTPGDPSSSAAFDPDRTCNLAAGAGISRRSW